MNNKGFTLVELIGAIVILAIILVIITPLVTTTLKKGVEDADKQTINSIKAAARSYVSDYRDESCVNISKLQMNGYLEDDIEWPSNKEKVQGSVKIEKQSNDAGKIKYTITYCKSLDCTGTCN